MEKCCEISCEKPVIENTQLGRCTQHEGILMKQLEMEYKQQQEDTYNDYITDIRSSI